MHRWYNFIAGYSPEFVEGCISGGGLRAGALVVDPFAGCGTTLVVARSMGMRAAGFEPHPFFSLIAKAKTLASPCVQDIDQIRAAITRGLLSPSCEKAVSPDAWVFLSKLFENSVLCSLLGARVSLERAKLERHPLAFLILSRLVDECSFAQTDGIYKAPTSRKVAADPLKAVARIFSEIAKDILVDGNITSPDVVIYQSTSANMREIDSNSADMIVTSPPYLNNFDYAEMTRMHLYFWNMAGTWKEISNTVRANLVVNTTTALAGHRDRQSEYASRLPSSISGEVGEVVDSLSLVKKTKRGKKDYDLIVYPYLSQIIDVYEECFRSLKPGSVAHTVIADAAFYGIHVASPQWLVEILKMIGFSEVECRFIRKRGHRWVLEKRAGSPIGLGEYHIIARK